MKQRLLASLPMILPIASAWAEKQEALILQKGEPLSEIQTADARRAGVAHSEKIRILWAETLPEPDHAELLFLAKQLGLFSPKTTGFAIGYGISLQPALREDRCTFVHQCVHVAQCERLGGIRPFLNDYARECIEPGYPFGTLEQEALLVARDICKPPPAGR
jgi:hypothetical protein